MALLPTADARSLAAQAAAALSRARWACVAVLAMAVFSDGGCSVPERRAPAAPTAPTPHGQDDGDDDDTDAADAGTWPVATATVFATGNRLIRGFDDAKKELGRIYATAGQGIDLYCGCSFLAVPGHGMRVDLAACGYVVAKDRARAERIEWEHAVPASAFGHTFAEWRDGDPKCVDHRGKKLRGRKCARMASPEFSRIEADLHNLFPVVGEVNGLRSDLPMGVLDGARAPRDPGVQGSSFHFGACQSAIERGVFLPRREVRGDLARAYKYMNASYPERHLIDETHRALFDAWDLEDPPDAWERERNRRIAARQGNTNTFIGD